MFDMPPGTGTLQALLSDLAMRTLDLTPAC